MSHENTSEDDSEVNTVNLLLRTSLSDLQDLSLPHFMFFRIFSVLEISTVNYLSNSIIVPKLCWLVLFLCN